MAARFGMATIVADNERALLAFLRAAAAGLEGVEVIEQASPEGITQRMDSQVGVREVKAQTRVLKTHLEETAGLEWTIGDMVGSTLSKLLVEVQNSGRWEDARSQENVGRQGAKDAWQAMRRD